MKICAATPADAEGMSQVLSEIVALRGVERPRSVAFVRGHYIEHPDRVACSVAVDDDGRVLGFQSLRRADATRPYGVQEGWGIIGTHVSPRAARRGVGAALFQVSREAARQVGLPRIVATIGDDNAQGLAYYEAMGFRIYRLAEGAICKVFEVSSDREGER